MEWFKTDTAYYGQVKNITKVPAVSSNSFEVEMDTPEEAQRIMEAYSEAIFKCKLIIDMLFIAMVFVGFYSN